MKTLFRLLTITVFCAIFAIAASAKTVQITDFGAIPDDGGDDTSAIKDAVSDLAQNGGGTLVFPSGVTEFSGYAEFNPFNKVSLRVVGDKGSYIKLNGDRETNFFTIFRATQVEFDGLTFIADNLTELNARKVIWVKEAVQTKISRCEFIGVGAFEALIEFNNTMATVEDTYFGGSGSSNSVLVSDGVKSFTVSNSTFNNEGQYMDVTVDKTGVNEQQHWISVGNDEEIGKGAIRVKDSSFDSGALKSIFVQNQMSVIIDGITVNVKDDKNASGVVLQNVGYAETVNSTFDTPGRPRRAFELKNGTYMELNAVTLLGQTIFGDVDGDSGYFARYCPSCRIPEAKGRK